MRLNEATEITFMQISITIYVTAISGREACMPMLTLVGQFSFMETKSRAFTFCQEISKIKKK